MTSNHHHPNHPDVDQSDRTVPRNLRQTGDADVDAWRLPIVVCDRVHG